MTIKVKATYPKETEVALKMDEHSADVLRAALEYLCKAIAPETITEYVMESVECNEADVSDVLFSIISGLKEELS